MARKLTTEELVKRARMNPPYASMAEYLRSYRARIRLGWPTVRPPRSERERREHRRKYHREYARRRRAKQKEMQK